MLKWYKIIGVLQGTAAWKQNLQGKTIQIELILMFEE